jgi:hypothetical protein
MMTSGSPFFTLAFAGEDGDDFARHRRGEAAAFGFGFAGVGHWVVPGQLVVGAVGEDVEYVAVAQHGAVGGWSPSLML